MDFCLSALLFENHEVMFGCLSNVVLMVDVLTVLFLIFCHHKKIQKEMTAISIIWIAVALASDVFAFVYDGCILTILSIFLSIILLVVCLYLVLFEGDYEKPECKKTAPVIESTKEEKVSNIAKLSEYGKIVALENNLSQVYEKPETKLEKQREESQNTKSDFPQTRDLTTGLSKNTDNVTVIKPQLGQVITKFNNFSNGSFNKFSVPAVQSKQKIQTKAVHLKIEKNEKQSKKKDKVEDEKSQKNVIHFFEMKDVLDNDKK